MQKRGGETVGRRWQQSRKISPIIDAVRTLYDKQCPGPKGRCARLRKIGCCPKRNVRRLCIAARRPSDLARMLTRGGVITPADAENKPYELCREIRSVHVGSDRRNWLRNCLYTCRKLDAFEGKSGRDDFA